MVSDWKGNISATIRPITTINTSIQSSIHCACSREKRGEKALQTSEIHGKRRRKASCGLSMTNRDHSRSVEQLRSSFFLESIGIFFLVTSSIECKTIRVAITTENGCFCATPGRDRGSTAKASAFPWVGELQTNATARVHGGFFQIKYLRLGGKYLSIGTFLMKIRAKMTPQRRFKAIDDYPSKFDWPGIKGLRWLPTLL